MALPRSSYVKDGSVGVYHCFSRCVRRAFLCGFDQTKKMDEEYFDLVDTSGRILHPTKHAAINPDLSPILLRIGANPDAWPDTIAHFSSKFRRAAGLLSSLRNFADQLGRRWLTGVSAARKAFATSPLQSI
jgi:hypothetical protein